MIGAWGQEGLTETVTKRETAQSAAVIDQRKFEAQERLRVQRELEAAEARIAQEMATVAPKRGFSLWLIPLIALVPLGFLHFRRKK